MTVLLLSVFLRDQIGSTVMAPAGLPANGALARLKGDFSCGVPEVCPACELQRRATGQL